MKSICWKRLFSILLVALLTAMTLSMAVAEEEVPTVVIYQNSGKIGAESKTASTTEAYNAVHQAILDATGVDVQVIVPVAGTETEKLNLLLGSGTQFDLFWGFWQTYKDIAMPLNDLLESHGQQVLERCSANMANMTDIDGVIYGIPRAYNLCPYPTWLRTDWMEALGLEWPTTTNEYVEVLREMKAAYPDAWPLVTGPSLEQSLHCFLGGFVEGGVGNWMDDDGQLKPYYLNKGYKDFLTWMNGLYTEGLIYPECYSSDTDGLRELIKQNKVASFAGWYSRVTLMTPYLKEIIPEADYDWIRNFSGPAGFCETPISGGSYALIIPNTSKNAEAMMKVVNWCLADKANFMTTNYGIQDVHWTWVDEATGTFDVINTDYIGEFVIGEGPMDKTIMPNNAMQFKHYTYIHNESWDGHKEMVSFPADFGVLYDMVAMTENVMTYNDLARLVEEESIKFITGSRDLATYDEFVNEINSFGVENYIAEINRQYSELID
jgi:putative aldouronate transport system substrate-binding protein